MKNLWRNQYFQTWLRLSIPLVVIHFIVLGFATSWQFPAVEQLPWYHDGPNGEDIWLALPGWLKISRQWDLILCPLFLGLTVITKRWFDNLPESTKNYIADIDELGDRLVAVMLGTIFLGGLVAGLGAGFGIGPCTLMFILGLGFKPNIWLNVGFDVGLVTGLVSVFYVRFIPGFSTKFVAKPSLGLCAGLIAGLSAMLGAGLGAGLGTVPIVGFSVILGAGSAVLVVCTLQLFKLLVNHKLWQVLWDFFMVKNVQKQNDQ